VFKSGLKREEGEEWELCRMCILQLLRDGPGSTDADQPLAKGDRLDIQAVPTASALTTIHITLTAISDPDAYIPL
jgi:hypothetical protein